MGPRETGDCVSVVGNSQRPPFSFQFGDSLPRSSADGGRDPSHDCHLRVPCWEERDTAGPTISSICRPRCHASLCAACVVLLCPARPLHPICRSSLSTEPIRCTTCAGGPPASIDSGALGASANAAIHCSGRSARDTAKNSYRASTVACAGEDGSL